MMSLLIVFLAVIVFADIQQSGQQPLNDGWKEEFEKSTADRIKDHGYPSEVHQVETVDNYLITMFRIPFSNKLQNENQQKPAVLLQHGLTSSSDCWILSGPNDALAFLLADAGYDVWMGNARGNRYSRNNTRLSPNHPFFWRFSWHEIGIYDMPAMIDYILETTGESATHYVGHSQGTTVFFVMTSSRPEYNNKIKTAHALAPVAFMGNMTTLMAKYTRRLVGKPNKLTRLLDTMEILPSTMIFVELEETYCSKNATLAFMCSNLIYLLHGDPGSKSNTNMTIWAQINQTHPAGASSTQVLHYMQEYESGRFCQFDYGEKKNLIRYGKPNPPDYKVSQITSNVFMYYSDGDTLSDVSDVEYLATLLPKEPHMFHVPDPTFSHADFIWSLQVKEMINDRIIKACNDFEGYDNKNIVSSLYTTH